MSTEPTSIRSQLAHFYEQLLKEQGYQPRFDDDGDIVFKSEGKNLLLYVDTDDDEFFRLALPAFFLIENETESKLAEKVASIVTKKIKVVKIIRVGDRLWASVEMFCAPIQSVQDVLERCIDVLHLGVRQFRLEYNELMESVDEECDFDF